MKISVFYEHIKEAAAQTGKPVREILQYAKACGIRALELDGNELLENKGLGELVLGEGFLVASVYINCDFTVEAKPDEIERFVEAVRAVKSKNILCIPGLISSDDEEYDIKLGKMAEGLNKLCAAAGADGIAVSLEDYDNSRAPYATVSGLLKLLEGVPELRITFDTGNFRYSCEDELEAYDCLRKKIVHVHTKDRSLERTAEGYTVCVDGAKVYPAVVGSGIIKMKECIERLIADGYDGYYAIEHFGAPDQTEYIKMSTEYLKSFEAK